MGIETEPSEEERDAANEFNESQPSEAEEGSQEVFDIPEIKPGDKQQETWRNYLRAHFKQERGYDERENIRVFRELDRDSSACAVFLTEAQDQIEQDIQTVIEAKIDALKQTFMEQNKGVWNPAAVDLEYIQKQARKEVYTEYIKAYEDELSDEINSLTTKGIDEYRRKKQQGFAKSLSEETERDIFRSAVKSVVEKYLANKRPPE